MAVLYVSKVDLQGAMTYWRALPKGLLAGSEGYKREEDRARSLCCRYLLYTHLKNEGLHPEEERLLFSRGEKPALEKTPLQFSFSHSGALAAVLISEARCGVDVERVRSLNTDLLAARLFCEDIYEDYGRAEDKTGFFIAQFTKMEAKGKYYGTGLLRERVSFSDLAEVKTRTLCLGDEKYCLSYMADQTPGILLSGENLSFAE